MTRAALLLVLICASVARADDRSIDGLIESAFVASAKKLVGEQALLIRKTKDTHDLLLVVQTVKRTPAGGLEITVRESGLGSAMSLETRCSIGPGGKLQTVLARALPAGWGTRLQRGPTGWTKASVPGGKPKPWRRPAGGWPETLVAYVFPRLVPAIGAGRHSVSLINAIAPKAGTQRALISTPGDPHRLVLRSGREVTLKVRVAPNLDLIEYVGRDRVGEPVPVSEAKKLMRDRLLANEYRAMNLLCRIRSEQRAHFRGRQRYPSGLDRLSRSVQRWVALDKAYAYRVVAAPGGKTGMATASPREPGKTGRRWFAVEEQGRIYWRSKPFPDDGTCRIPKDAQPVATGPKPR